MRFSLVRPPLDEAFDGGPAELLAEDDDERFFSIDGGAEGIGGFSSLMGQFERVVVAGEEAGQGFVPF